MTLHKAYQEGHIINELKHELIHALELLSTGTRSTGHPGQRQAAQQQPPAGWGHHGRRRCLRHRRSWRTGSWQGRTKCCLPWQSGTQTRSWSPGGFSGWAGGDRECTVVRNAIQLQMLCHEHVTLPLSQTWGSSRPSRPRRCRSGRRWRGQSQSRRPGCTPWASCTRLELRLSWPSCMPKERQHDTKHGW